MKILLWLFGIIVVSLLAFVIYALACSRIDPVVWEPGPNPGLTGVFASNEALGDATMMLRGIGVGPEDIALGADGWMYTSYRDGRIVRFNTEGQHDEFVNTGGYPLGMRIDGDNNLIVADAEKGLLSISQDGAIDILANSVNGKPMKFVDAVDIAEDGTIWFTDASMRFSHHDSIVHVYLDGRSTGRLLSYSRATGEVTVRLDGLAFSNGVAVAPGDEYVLVNETFGSRTRRLWLQGAKAGKSDFFVEGLPGAPDNISVDEDGTYWVAIAGIRDPKFEKLADKPFIRKLISVLPTSILEPPGTHAFILGLDGDGNVIHNLQDPQSDFRTTTSAIRNGDVLYIGSLGTDAVGVLKLH